MRNLASLLGQLDFYGSIPARCASLKNQLKTGGAAALVPTQPATARKPSLYGAPREDDTGRASDAANVFVPSSGCFFRYKRAMELELWRAALQRHVAAATERARHREAVGQQRASRESPTRRRNLRAKGPSGRRAKPRSGAFLRRRTVTPLSEGSRASATARRRPTGTASTSSPR